MFNEYQRWHDEKTEAECRAIRVRQGISEAEHAAWLIWCAGYEELKNNLENGHYSIAFQYDEHSRNIARN